LPKDCKRPCIRQLGNLNLLVFFVGVVAATVFAGVPIAFAFGLAVFGYLALTTQTPLMVLIGRMDEGMSHLILLAVPLFVFLDLLIEISCSARCSKVSPQSFSSDRSCFRSREPSASTKCITQWS
jgi:hypothetical protein